MINFKKIIILLFLSSLILVPAKAETKLGLVILTEFKDTKTTVNGKYVRSRFSELNHYLEDMSYQKQSLKIEHTNKWYRLSHPSAYYKISAQDQVANKTKLRRLISETLKMAEKDNDLSKYDLVTIFLAAKREQFGAMGVCAYPGVLGYQPEDAPVTFKGTKIKGLNIFCYQAHIGTLFHDTANLFGSVKGSAKNLGFWDPMSSNHYYKWSQPPPGISSWTKLQLGWIDPDKIRIVKPSQKSGILLDPLEDAGASTLVIKVPLSDTSYYLVENRQPIGYDKYAPGQGALILYVDETQREGQDNQSPVRLKNADPTLPRLLGAAFEVGKKDIYIDEEHNLKIDLVGKVENSYQIMIRPHR